MCVTNPFASSSDDAYHIILFKSFNSLKNKLNMIKTIPITRLEQPCFFLKLVADLATVPVTMEGLSC